MNGFKKNNRPGFLPVMRVLEISWHNIIRRKRRSFISIIITTLAISFIMPVIAHRAIIRRSKISTPPHIIARVQKPEASAAGKLFVKHLGKIRDVWLLVIAVIMSMLWLAKSSLESFSRRFKEIGIMKCLGALNTHIFQLFFVEMLIQNLIAMIFGVILGMAFTFIPLYFVLGPDIWFGFPLLNLSFFIFLSLLITIVVSAGGVIYPAFLAIRAAPIDIIRVEK